MTRTSLLGLVGLLALGGCGQPRDLAATPDGVVGTVVVESDVSDLPDRPDPDGWVAAIPVNEIADVVALAGDGATERDLPEVRFALPLETVEELGGVVAEVDGDGRFRLDAVGEHLVCRLYRSRWDDGVVGTSGCVVADLPARGVVRVTYGEAGMTVRPAG